jgi:hypothetical protein
MKPATIIIAITLTLFQVGCATVESKVSRFHTLSSVSSAKTFKFIQLDGQAGSIEFDSYAQRVSKKLQAYGWRHETTKTPDVAVFISYWIGDGKSVSESMPIFGQTGGGTSYTSGSVYAGGRPATFSATTFTAPTYGQVGVVPIHRTYYTRTLVMKIHDLKQGNKSIFEGRVVSTGTSSQISEVMPNMIDALFKKFPGESGKTITVEEAMKK